MVARDDTPRGSTTWGGPARSVFPSDPVGVLASEFQVVTSRCQFLDLVYSLDPHNVQGETHHKARQKFHFSVRRTANAGGWGNAMHSTTQNLSPLPCPHGHIMSDKESAAPYGHARKPGRARVYATQKLIHQIQATLAPLLRSLYNLVIHRGLQPICLVGATRLKPSRARRLGQPRSRFRSLTLDCTRQPWESQG